ncbi:MAG TPA: thioredoxin family protein [Bacteroidia bacterium]|jgi:thioredoxin-related protein|nr:thioredoxin family protein [Bacteroidia bacterium]
MKTKHFFFLTLLALGASAFTGEYTSLEIGKPLPKPELKVADVSGKSVSLGEAKGKNGLLVIFSCNTCPFVIKNESRIKEISAYALKNEYGVVVVNSNESQRDGDDSFEAMKKYKAEKQFSGYYVLDKNSELANAFGATHTPETYLFSKAGTLVYKGAIDDSPRDEASVKEHYLKEAMDAAMKGQVVKTNSTKSVGCGIKRKEA